jgi:hypothetical protein
MLSGEPAGTGFSAGFDHVEGGTYLCSDAVLVAIVWIAVVWFIFPTDHDPQVLKHLGLRSTESLRLLFYVVFMVKPRLRLLENAQW